MKKKKVFVGRYAMNSGTVLLWLDLSTADSSARHEWDEKTGYACKIEVGVKGKAWNGVVQSMLHEFIEASAQRERVHLSPTWQFGSPTDSYFLVMSHPQFTQVVNEAGDALAYALDDARKAFDKLKKKEKAK